MPAQPEKKKRVLFVDDEPAFLEMIQQLARQYCSDDWEVAVANGASQALAALQRQNTDLVVLDVQMPIVDGLQFLSLLNRKFPQLQKVVLTGFASEDYRVACLAGGAELFLEKPRTVDGFEIVLATLNELTRLKHEEGFRGVLRRVSIQDVIQMECLSRHSTILEIVAGHHRGEIFIQEGSIIHAQIGAKSGEIAFNEILGLAGGEFLLKPFAAPAARTIEGQWEFILMEACRHLDEAAATAAATPESSEPAETPIPWKEQPELTAPSEDKPVPTATTAARPRARIDEVLICSAQGEVLYEHKCPDANQRVAFLEFISQRARQTAQALPTGDMKQVIFHASKARLIVRIQTGCGVFVRATPIPPETGKGPADVP